jgi:glycerol kinase
MAGDQQAALFGQACFDVGDVKCTYGTGAFILMNTGSELVRSEHGLITTVGWRLGADGPTVYALEGSVFIAGAAVQWLRDGLGIIRHSSEVEALARRVEDTGNLVFVPALVGLGAPHWRSDARGMIRGIGRDTTAAHLARATLEGIALQVHEVVDATRKDAGPIHTIRVDGGASANDLLMQIQAELAGQAVSRPDVIETTAAGAAFLAGLATDVFPSVDAIEKRWRLSKKFEPQEPALGEQLLAKWRDALERL